jgi:hypothetical protein
MFKSAQDASPAGPIPPRPAPHLCQVSETSTTRQYCSERIIHTAKLLTVDCKRLSAETRPMLLLLLSLAHAPKPALLLLLLLPMLASATGCCCMCCC